MDKNRILLKNIAGNQDLNQASSILYSYACFPHDDEKRQLLLTGWKYQRYTKPENGGLYIRLPAPDLERLRTGDSHDNILSEAQESVLRGRIAGDVMLRVLVYRSAGYNSVSVRMATDIQIALIEKQTGTPKIKADPIGHNPLCRIIVLTLFVLKMVSSPQRR